MIIKVNAYRIFSIAIACITFIFAGKSINSVETKTDLDIANDNIIIWNDSIKLAVGDYQCITPPKTTASAISKLEMSASYYWQGDSIMICNSSAVFYKRRSWIDLNRLTEITIPHEQIHFDICEYYSRLFLIEMLQSRPNLFNYDIIFNENKNKIFILLEKAHNKFDADIASGDLKSVHKDYRNKLDSLLKFTLTGESDRVEIILSK